MFKQLAHAAYRVRDLDATLAFFGDKLGIREAFRLHHPDTGKLLLVYLQVARDQFIEVFPTDPTVELAGGNRYMHLCLEVADLEATVAELRRRGVRIVRELKRGFDGNLQAWIQDPDCNDIELMQINPESPQARAGAAWAGGKEQP